MSVLARLHPFTGVQHGLVSRSQAALAGVDDRMIARGVRRGDLRLVTPRVLAVVGAPESSDQRLMAAVLDHGGTTAVSGDAALALWGLPGFRPEPIDLVTTRGRRSRATALATVHTSTYLPAHHLTRLRGIPIVTPTRAIFDESRAMHPARLERTIDNCWARGLTSGRHLHAMFDELRRRGRPRITTVRRLLADRGPDYVPPESGLEARFHQICREHALPPMRRQVETGDYCTWLGRIDFRDEILPLLAQLNSDLHHASLIDRRTDAEQTARLEAAGYVVLSIWQFDVWHEPSKVVADVKRGRRLARQNLQAHPNLSPDPAAHSILSPDPARSGGIG